ncbi:MAG: PQQ-like beta-propeller repeat protein, partial [Planctomycetes bacterium]|nr:PQQ-like beta-propeller repeat protein [Planctomycetota bacterium]
MEPHLSIRGSGEPVNTRMWHKSPCAWLRQRNRLPCVLSLPAKMYDSSLYGPSNGERAVYAVGQSWQRGGSTRDGTSASGAVSCKARDRRWTSAVFRPAYFIPVDEELRMHVRRTSRSLLLAALMLSAGFSSASFADGLIASPEQGWPQWRGPRRDGVSEERGLLPAWPEGGPRLLWKTEGLGTGWSSPIVVDGRLFITGDVDGKLVVFALDLAGRELWRAFNGEAWEGSYPGARASCCYSQGRVYHLNAHGQLACLAADAGKPLWTVNILDRFNARNITWAISECVLVDGEHVIVTPGGRGALMAALNKRDGSTVWTAPPLDDD